MTTSAMAKHAVATSTKKLLESVTIKDVNLKEIIGTGTYSRVYEAGVVLFDDSDRKEVICVAKRVRGGNIVEVTHCLERVCKTLWQPGSGKVDHPNIVRFLGVWFQPTIDLPWILSEKMDISLANYLSLQAKTNPEKSTLMSLLRDVANGLEFLHDPEVQLPIIHGDLTANNVLISKSVDTLVAKIGDLGVREILGKGVCPSCSSYRSPEAQKSNHTPCVADDIYSMGVMIIHTLLQEYPEEHQASGNFSGYLARLSTVCQFGNQIIYECVCEYLNKEPIDRPHASVVFNALDAQTDITSAPVTLQGLKVNAHSIVTSQIIYYKSA